MDGQRFDELTRSLAAVASRRRLLTTITSGALATLGTLLANDSGRAEHGCRHAGRACRRDGQCCSGDCLGNNTCRCARASQCPQPTNPCKKAVCTGTGRCTFGNKANGVICPDGICCGGNCVDHSTNPNNCGECGHVCQFTNATARCAAGSCVLDTCDSGYLDCDGIATNGCEVDSLSDENNCGGCGNVCVSGTCEFGFCVAICGDGICDAAAGENCVTCPADCGAC